MYYLLITKRLVIAAVVAVRGKFAAVSRCRFCSHGYGWCCSDNAGRKILLLHTDVVVAARKMLAAVHLCCVCSQGKWCCYTQELLWSQEKCVGEGGGGLVLSFYFSLLLSISCTIATKEAFLVPFNDIKGQKLWEMWEMLLQSSD